MSSESTTPASSPDGTISSLRPPGDWPSTCWSVVAGARQREGDGELFRDCMGQLFRLYRRPLFRLFLRLRPDPSLGEDALQDLFCSCLEQEVIQSVDPEKGRFRSWIWKVAWHHFHNFLRARKGSEHEVGLDAAAAVPTPSTVQAALERDFDRDYARSTMDLVMAQARASANTQTKHLALDLVATLLREQAGRETPIPHDELAQRFGISRTDVKNHLARGRAHIRRVLEQVVRETLPAAATPQEIQEEMGYIVQLLRRDGS